MARWELPTARQSVLAEVVVADILTRSQQVSCQEGCRLTQALVLSLAHQQLLVQLRLRLQRLTIIAVLACGLTVRASHQLLLWSLSVRHLCRMERLEYFTAKHCRVVAAPVLTRSG